MPLFYDEPLKIEWPQKILENFGSVAPSFMTRFWERSGPKCFWGSKILLEKLGSVCDGTLRIEWPPKNLGKFRQHCPLFYDQSLGIKWPKLFWGKIWAAFWESTRQTIIQSKIWAAFPPFLHKVLTFQWPQKTNGSILQWFPPLSIAPATFATLSCTGPTPPPLPTLLPLLPLLSLPWGSERGALPTLLSLPWRHSRVAKVAWVDCHEETPSWLYINGRLWS